MPDRSYREMNVLQRQHYALSARVFRMSILGSLVIGIISMLIGLGFYIYALIGQYIGEGFILAQNTEGVLQRLTPVASLCEEVMSRYENAEEALRLDQTSEKYRAIYEDVLQREDYKETTSLLHDFYEHSQVDALYLVMYDRERARMVYIADGDFSAENNCLPGDWDSVSSKGVDKFFQWDGKGRLYDIGRTEKYGWLVTTGVPIYSENREIVGFVFSDIELTSVLVAAKNYFIQYSVGMLIVVNLIAVIFARRMRKRLVNPINEIAEAAQDYVKDKRAGALATDHFSTLNIATGDEIENLSLVMADMERDLSEYTENLVEVTAEKERISTELTLANRIQADMLPNIFPAFPERNEFDVYAAMTPAKEVGGDFYDFFLIDEDLLGLVIADVSGKGIPAALFMMASKILIKNFATSIKEPAKVLEAVNNQICANNREEMFITVWLGILNLKSGILKAANAGHEYPILKKADGKFELLKDKHGFVIGGMPNVRYKEYEIKMDPGSKLFVYTDGVVEATNSTNELFGAKRTIETLQKAQDYSPMKILEEVDHAVNAFVGDAPQFDDLTMMCVSYTGQEQQMDKGRPREIRMEASLNSIPIITDFVNAQLEEKSFSSKTIRQIDIAIDEILSNIARFAYAPSTGTVAVRINFEDDFKKVVLVFEDQGTPYNPIEKEDPDVTLSAEEREIGGLGIYLVKKTMDEIDYERKDGKNLLTIKKGM